MSRREFLARTAGTASGAVAIAAIAACGDGIVSGSTPNQVVIAPNQPFTPFSVVVADFPDLATVGRLAQVGSFQAAKRTGASTFDAFSMACTHEGCLTGLVNANRFDCPCHGSRFDANGNVVIGPATQPLQKLTTSYDAATDKLTIG